MISMPTHTGQADFSRKKTVFQPALRSSSLAPRPWLPAPKPWGRVPFSDGRATLSGGRATLSGDRATLSGDRATLSCDRAPISGDRAVSRANRQTASLLVCLLLCISLTGCTVCQNAKRTMLVEPREFSWRKDRKESVEMYRCWADQAWREQCSSDPEQSVSSAYVAGFKDGFVDYVYAGGPGEPPPVPPRQFWNADQRNPCGHAAATDWFAGFRHGAQLAREEGYRKRALVPASIFLVTAPETCRTCQPSCLEPQLVPLGQPLPAELVQPELVRPAVDKPAASREGSNSEGPTDRAPAAEAPGENVQAVEKLPLPDDVPALLQGESGASAPASPRPLPSVDNSPRPLPNVDNIDADQIYGPQAIDLGANDRRLIHRSAFEQSANQAAQTDVSQSTETTDPANRVVERIAAAMAAAASRSDSRAKSRYAKLPNLYQYSDSEPTDDRADGRGGQTSVGSTLRLPTTSQPATDRPATISAPRQVTFPGIHGRVLNMFPQFSR